VGDCTDSRDACNFKCWVRWSFDKHELGSCGDCCGNVGSISCVYERHVNTEVWQQLLEQPGRPAINSAATNHVIAALEKSKKECGFCGEACAETHGPLCVFQRAEGVLECFYRRVPDARILMGRDAVNPVATKGR
jgi:hypothetical protein